MDSLKKERRGEERESGRNSRRRSRTIKLKLVAELFNCIFDSGVGAAMVATIYPSPRTVFLARSPSLFSLPSSPFHLW